MALKVHFKNRLFNLDIHYYVVNVEGFKRLLFLGNRRAGNLQARTIPYYCIYTAGPVTKMLRICCSDFGPHSSIFSKFIYVISCSTCSLEMEKKMKVHTLERPDLSLTNLPGNQT